jgi:hypothetical protein
MKRVLLVSVEPPWPAHHGGRIRTARVAETLAERFDVLVAYPEHGVSTEQTPVASRALPWSAPSGVLTRASSRPHLGGHYLRPVTEGLRRLASEFRPDAVYWSHSYLAPWCPPALRDRPQIVEFANLESNRLRTLAASASGAQKVVRSSEAWKASRWEPAVAEQASLCVALNDADEAALQRWTDRVVLAPNGVDRFAYAPSPLDGYAVALASYDYEPNAVAVRDLVRSVWPRVVAQHPAARLVVAGRRSEAFADEFAGVPGVSVLGTLDDVAQAYAGAAISLAPAQSGGGSQLKLSESMSRGRSVVMSPFAAAGMPPALRQCDGYWVADGPDAFADAIVAALTGLVTRYAKEKAAWDACEQLTWAQTTDDLATAMAHLMEAGK